MTAATAPRSASPNAGPTLDWARLRDRHNLQKARFDRYVPPADFASFDDWRIATQRYQAELIRRHVEVLRRLKYRPTGGFAQFCLADGHPGVTWSVLDHERRPKLGYEALRERAGRWWSSPTAYRRRWPPGTHWRSTCTSSRTCAWRSTTQRVAARLEWPGGCHEWRWAGDVPSDSCVRVGTLQTVVPEADGPLRLDLELHLSRRDVIVNHYRSTIAD